MCGIVGYSTLNAKISLVQALFTLNHRGPDGHGEYYDGVNGVGLGHTRLSIVDLAETGKQPMRRSADGLVITYNGELYDYRALRDDLIASGEIFHGSSDTEVLLALLETKGMGVISELNGIFAFAIHDPQSGILTVVRDAFGVKPLYYAETSGGFYFSSEVRGLVAMGVIALEPSPEVVALHLTYLWNPCSSLVSPNIRKLGPGEALSVRLGRVERHWRWYRPPALRPVPVKANASIMARQTAEHLRRAVHRQMVADVPVGAFLSGGLDSSSVVAFAREQVPDIQCFTIENIGGAEPGMTDDLPFARSAASKMGVPLEVVQVDSESMVKDLMAMVEQLEEPLADPACLNVLYISRIARDRGIKVLLSGAGGDDLFTGYRRHRAVTLDRWINRMPRPLRLGISSMSRLLPTSIPLYRRLRKLLDGLHLNLDDRLINYFVWTARRDLLELLTIDFREAVREYDLAATLRSYLEDMPESADPIDRILALEQRYFLTDHNLLYTDKMSMATSVEVRVPFLDSELSSFAATIPACFKQHGQVGKWILKKAMEPYLPREIIYRPKSGFGAPLRRWMQGELRVLMDDLLSYDSISRRGIFDAKGVAKLVEADSRGRIDSSYTILSIMCIELWCRAFRDNRLTGHTDGVAGLPVSNQLDLRQGHK